MSDFDPNNMSRMAKSRKQSVEPNFERQGDRRGQKHKNIKIFLVILGLAILSIVPVCGFLANQKTSEQTATSTSHKASNSTSKQSSSESSVSESSSESSSSESVEEDSEVSDSTASSSDTNDTESSSASSSVATNSTAVLGASQTLYNFAVTNGLTTDQVIALNPGLTVNNYTQYAGQSLNIK